MIGALRVNVDMVDSSTFLAFDLVILIDFDQGFTFDFFRNESFMAN